MLPVILCGALEKPSEDYVGMGRRSCEKLLAQNEEQTKRREDIELQDGQKLEVQDERQHQAELNDQLTLARQKKLQEDMDYAFSLELQNMELQEDQEQPEGEKRRKKKIAVQRQKMCQSEIEVKKRIKKQYEQQSEIEVKKRIQKQYEKQREIELTKKGRDEQQRKLERRYEQQRQQQFALKKRKTFKDHMDCIMSSAQQGLSHETSKLISDKRARMVSILKNMYALQSNAEAERIYFGYNVVRKIVRPTHTTFLIMSGHGLSVRSAAERENDKGALFSVMRLFKRAKPGCEDSVLDVALVPYEDVEKIDQKCKEVETLFSDCLIHSTLLHLQHCLRLSSIFQYCLPVQEHEEWNVRLEQQLNDMRVYTAQGDIW